MYLMLICSVPGLLPACLPDTLPPEKILTASIDTFWAQTTRAQQLEYQISRKDDWMLWLPGVGLTYTLAGKPRPTLSYSLHDWFNVRKANREKAAKVRSIAEKNRLEAEKEKASLRALLRKHAILSADLKRADQYLQTNAMIFHIYEQEYRQGEMTPTDFLPKKAQYEEREAILSEKSLQLSLLEAEILEKSHR